MRLLKLNCCWMAFTTTFFFVYNTKLILLLLGTEYIYQGGKIVYIYKAKD